VAKLDLPTVHNRLSCRVGGNSLSKIRARVERGVDGEGLGGNRKELKNGAGEVLTLDFMSIGYTLN